MITPSRRYAAKRRRGAAFLLLVMMVLLVILAATQWLATATIANQQHENAGLHARSLGAALRQAQTLSLDWDQPLLLPIADNQKERIEIRADANMTTLTAIWMRGETEIARMSRPFES